MGRDYEAAAYSVGHHHCVTRFVTGNSLDACASQVGASAHPAGTRQAGVGAAAIGTTRGEVGQVAWFTSRRAPLPGDAGWNASAMSVGEMVEETKRVGRLSLARVFRCSPPSGPFGGILSLGRIVGLARGNSDGCR